jgi:hypothetical protein
LKEKGINVAVPAQIEIKRDFGDFSEPLPFDKIY